MIVAAVIFLILAALIVLWVLLAADGSDTVDLSLGGIDVNVHPLFVLLLGAVAMALALGALRLFYSGTKRSARSRKERKELQKREKSALKERDEAIAAREKDERARANAVAEERRSDADVTDGSYDAVGDRDNRIVADGDPDLGPPERR